MVVGIGADGWEGLSRASRATGHPRQARSPVDRAGPPSNQEGWAAGVTATAAAPGRGWPAPGTTGADPRVAPARIRWLLSTPATALPSRRPRCRPPRQPRPPVQSSDRVGSAVRDVRLGVHGTSVDSAAPRVDAAAVLARRTCALGCTPITQVRTAARRRKALISQRGRGECCGHQPSRIRDVRPTERLCHHLKRRSGWNPVGRSSGRQAGKDGESGAVPPL